MRIISITPVNKQKSKVLLEDFAFVLYNGEIRKYKICENGELTEAQYQEIEREILSARARERSLRLLESSDRTESQIRKTLEKDCYPENVIIRTLELLKSRGYINDQSFARHYAEYGGEKKSRKQLSWELSRKGLDRDTIAAALEEASPDEEAAVRRLVQKKVGDGTEMTMDERRKLFAWLGRKGYSYEIIRCVLGELWQD